MFAKIKSMIYTPSNNKPIVKEVTKNNNKETKVEQKQSIMFSKSAIENKPSSANKGFIIKDLTANQPKQAQKEKICELPKQEQKTNFKSKHTSRA